MTDLVADWLLGRVISAGQHAEVREATVSGIPVSHVLKRLHRHAARDAAIRTLFERECELTCALPASPQLVRGIHADITGDQPYLVMERGGRNLREHLEESPLARAEMLQLVTDTAVGVAHLHAHGWIHGDVNPSNLLWDAAHAIVCDLGVARAVGADGPVRGTAAYMAPEQVRGERWTPAVDVFALGVLLWELVRGERLFHRGASYLSMAAVVETDAPELTDASLGKIAMAALSKRPSDRPSAAEFAVALRGAPRS